MRAMTQRSHQGHNGRENSNPPFILLNGGRTVTAAFKVTEAVLRHTHRPELMAEWRTFRILGERVPRRKRNGVARKLRVNVSLLNGQAVTVICRITGGDQLSSVGTITIQLLTDEQKPQWTYRWERDNDGIRFN